MRWKRLDVILLVVVPLLTLGAVFHLNTQVVMGVQPAAQEFCTLETAAEIDLHNQSILNELDALGFVSPHVAHENIDIPIERLRELAFHRAQLSRFIGSSVPVEEYFLTRGQLLTIKEINVTRRTDPDLNKPVYVARFKGETEVENGTAPYSVEIVLDAKTGDTFALDAGYASDYPISVNIVDRGYYESDGFLWVPSPDDEIGQRNMEILSEFHALGLVSPYFDPSRVAFTIDEIRKRAVSETSLYGLLENVVIDEEYFLTFGQFYTLKEGIEVSRFGAPDRTIPVYMVRYHGELRSDSGTETKYAEIVVDMLNGVLISGYSGPIALNTPVDITIEDEGYSEIDTSLTPPPPSILCDRETPEAPLPEATEEN